MCHLTLSPQYVPHFYGIVFTLFAMFYSITGRYAQYCTGRCDKVYYHDCGCIAIAVIAMQHLHGKTLNVPEGWDNPFFGWNLNLELDRHCCRCQ